MATDPGTSVSTIPTGVPGPFVVGATGGSGTRVVARIVRDAGMYIGTDLNKSEDSLRFASFSDRWISDYLVAGDGRSALEESIVPDFESVLSEHLVDLPAAAAAWGWKEPRSIYLVDFFHRRAPSLRFLHFIRDGRDMAFSDNQQQLQKHGRAVFPDGWPSWRRPIRSIGLWNRVNLAAARFGEDVLGDHYLLVRFEDLCGEPATTVRRILEFFDLEGDADEIAASEVRPPGSLGRWKDEGKRLVGALEREAAEGLARFGYV